MNMNQENNTINNTINNPRNSENSILDKVISSKQVSEIQDFNPTEALAELLKKLSHKEADVLRRRFGLQDAELETLENIGKHYNVTRERIRQIENLGVKKMREVGEFSEIITPVEHVFHATFNQFGGFLTEEFLFEKLLSGPKSTPTNERAIIFILGKLLNEKFTKHPANEKRHPTWKVFTASEEFLETMIDELHALIHEHQKPMHFDDIHSKVKERASYEKHKNKLTEDVISALLDISQMIDVNPFGEYGLKHWGSIVPKRMDDKIFLILKKAEKPLHFTEIAKQISKTFKRRAYPPTVHNELILNADYVLVGRGIYALKEWGYKPGVVAEVLRVILEKNGKPLKRDELVKEVLKQRVVKRNTIHLALTNKKIFKKNPDDTYELVRVKEEQK